VVKIVSLPVRVGTGYLRLAMEEDGNDTHYHASETSNGGWVSVILMRGVGQDKCDCGNQKGKAAKYGGDKAHSRCALSIESQVIEIFRQNKFGPF
jgi:hypothetical protein